MSLFKVNGVVIPQPSEASYEEEDESSDSSGRSLDGTAHKDIVARKVKWTMAWPPLTAQELSLLLTTVRAKVFMTLEYPDPITNTQKIGTFYIGNRKTRLNWKKSNSGLWSEVAFNFIEQ